MHTYTCFVEPVVAFALEPTGSKFIVIHGEPPTRIMASFYNINDKGNKVTLLSESTSLCVCSYVHEVVCTVASGISRDRNNII